MKFIIYCSVLIFLCIGCANEETNTIEPIALSTKALAENILPSQLFELDINKDYSLITSSGVIIQIKKGTFESDKNPIQLEIKEALSMKDIFLAKLQTESNGEPLSSGGMIFINPLDGYNVTIKEKFTIYVPTEKYNNDMQLYDGEIDTAANINWVNPTSLSASQNAIKILNGENLFLSNCSSCHSIKENMTGPLLYNIQHRRTKKWLYDFTRNSAKMITSNTGSDYAEEIQRDTSTIDKDYYAECIYNQWNKTAMTYFPNLSDNDLNDLYTYIKIESDKYPDLEKKMKVTSCDSCEKYQLAKSKQLLALKKLLIQEADLFSLKQKIELNKNVLISKQKNPVLFQNASTLPAVSSERKNDTTRAILSTTEDVRPELYTGEYYELNITTFGWKNIDVLLKGQNGVEESILWIKVKDSEKYKMRVQLLIPSFKVSLEGARISNDMFSVKSTTGNITLPQGVSCYIVALTEHQDKLYFNIKNFIATKNQTIDIDLKEVNPDEINTALNSLQLDGFNSKIKEKENMKEVRRLDQELKEIQKNKELFLDKKKEIWHDLNILEKYKPKGCNCGIETTRSEKAYPGIVATVEELNIKKASIIIKE